MNKVTLSIDLDLLNFSQQRLVVFSVQFFDIFCQIYP